MKCDKTVPCTRGRTCVIKKRKGDTFFKCRWFNYEANKD